MQSAPFRSLFLIDFLLRTDAANCAAKTDADVEGHRLSSWPYAADAYTLDESHFLLTPHVLWLNICEGGFCLKLLIGLLFAVGVFFAVFFWGAGFGLRPSLVLAFVIVAVGFSLESKLEEQKRRPDISPYWVRIKPNWQEILTDHKLIGSTEEWLRIEGKLYYGKSADGAYNVLRDGLTFTVLKPQLFYWDNRPGFSSSLDFRERIPELRTDDGIIEFTPKFFVREREDFYSIGIITRESFKRVTMVGDDKELIELARVTSREFGKYGGLEQSAEDRKRTEEGLKNDGWTREDLRGEFFDVGRSFPASLKHKYFTLLHHSI